jgi:membrane-associated phospholipid phosphatase
MAPNDAPESKSLPPDLVWPSSWELPRPFGIVPAKIIARLGINLILLLTMLGVLAGTMWLHGGSIQWAQKSVLAPMIILVILLVARAGYWLVQEARGKSHVFPLPTIVKHTFQDWIPFILIDFIYENLHDFSEIFYTQDYAPIIMNLDMKLFGVELTQWSQKFFHPLLADYFAFTYGLYLLLPLFLMFVLSFRNLRNEIRVVILALSIAFLLGFIGYVFVPCSPPRFFLENAYTDPIQIHGWFLFDRLQGQWDRLSSVSAGAFPSLHVGLSTVALIFAFKFRKRSRGDAVLFWIFLPLVVSLWVSTVYLRHHWFVDIVAGLVVAVLACWGASGLDARWERFRARLGLKPIS